jgi:transposase
MRRTTATKPAITPIPVQWSEPEFTAFIFPHLSRPKRDPTYKLAYHRLFNLILWVLYTGMPWKCLPIPKDATGKPNIHDTNVYRAFAKWSDDGSLQQGFTASVAHLSAEKKLDLRVLHGDGIGDSGDKPQKGEKHIAMTDNHGDVLLPSLWLPSMRRT